MARITRHEERAERPPVSALNPDAEPSDINAALLAQPALAETKAEAEAVEAAAPKRTARRKPAA